ncbi:type I-E CRISPR-associated protein Cas6/Cse3/CasE [Streptomyces sp. XH2]|uniref:type I-E CRISPR-associated protein Cas6/Cse3/CasE n=1 Tax=Streptomyces sp. XH2 TaxID=3412483 RepID=UPI003C7C030D
MTTPLAPPATAHLTRIKIDPWSRDAGTDLKDAQALHRRVLSLVPDQLGAATRQAAGVLYRLERTPHAHTLLIQSTAPLHLEALPVGYAAATDERDITPLLTWCQPGKAIRYRIDAVATASISTDERDSKGRRKRGRRIPLHGPAAINWWHYHANRAGLSPDPATTHASPQPDLVGWKDNGRIGERLTRFEGTAHITDRDALRTAITTGLGRARAYGAGLLSIAPLTNP